jgi:CBS-domain-containing membrane protein
LREVVSKLSGSVHRVPVVNEQGRVVKIISQSSIIAWINQHLSSVDASQTISELDLGSKSVISVSNSMPAIETFKLMETHNLSGLAVVNDRGALCGATSARDLKVCVSATTRESTHYHSGHHHHHHPNHPNHPNHHSNNRFDLMVMV